AGVNGIEDLRAQTLAWARGEAMVPTHFAHRIAFNLIPAIDRFGADNYTGEEWKLINETRKILEAPELLISPTTVRVPVFTCHSLAVNVETEEKITAERARELFGRFAAPTVVGSGITRGSILRWSSPLSSSPGSWCRASRTSSTPGPATRRWTTSRRTSSVRRGSSATRRIRCWGGWSGTTSSASD